MITSSSLKSFIISETTTTLTKSSDWNSTMIASHNDCSRYVIINEDKIFTCGYDGQAFVFDIDESGNIDVNSKHVIVDSCGYLFVVALHEDKMFIGNSSYSIVEFDPNDYSKLDLVYPGHVDMIYHIIFAFGFMYSTGRDAKIIKWEIGNTNPIKQITFGQGKAFNLLSHNDSIVAISLNGQCAWLNQDLDSLAVWGTAGAETTFEVAQWFNGDSEIMYYGLSSNIVKIDLDSREKIGDLLGHSSTVLALRITNENQLISGSEDSSIRIWDLYEDTCLHLINVNESIWSLDFRNNKIFYCSPSHHIQQVELLPDSDWNFYPIDSSKSSKLDFSFLLESGEFSDLLIQGRKLHKSIINWRIPEYLIPQLDLIPLNELDDIIKWAYSGRVGKSVMLNDTKLIEPISLSMRNLLESDTGDFELIVMEEDEPIFIKVHKAILSARMELFRGMFQIAESSNSLEDKSGLTPDAWDFLLRWIYTGEIYLTADDDVEFIQDILADASDYFQLTSSNFSTLLSRLGK